MRKIFNETLLEIAKKDERIFMILADIGYGEVEPFADSFPERYYNCGVAEQNMTGVACGVAMEGNIAITYSIANFPTLRCLEQLRNDVCYHNQNVKVVIIGGGLAYGCLGISHHSTEDIAIMRALPNMVVCAPCDTIEAAAATHAMINHYGPFYYRCGYKGEKDIHEGAINFEIGKSIQIRDGKDAAVIFTGTIGYNTKIAVDNLKEEGINCRLISMHTIKPIDKEAIVNAAKETGNIITVEEHNLSGGLGSAVAEVLADEGILGVKFKRIALPDVNISYVATHQTLLDKYGMSAHKLQNKIRGAIKNK
jgi:transketolase